MSCSDFGCHSVPSVDKEHIGVPAGRREALTRNLDFLVSVCENSTQLADPSQFLNKLRETQQDWQACQAPLPSCREAVLELLDHFRSQVNSNNAPRAIVTDHSPLVDHEQPPSVRVTIENDDWRGLEKNPRMAREQLHHLGAPWNEVARVAHHELRRLKILELFFEDEAKRNALLRETHNNKGFTALKHRFGLKQPATVHQDIYEIKIWNVRVGRKKLTPAEIRGKIPLWSTINEVMLERAIYSKNTFKLELTNKDEAIKLLQRGYIILDNKKYTKLEAWDRRWDRFQCYHCLKDANHSAEWCKAQGTKPSCLWCAEQHAPSNCPVWGNVASKKCIYCKKNHCGTDSSCQDPDVVAELKKRDAKRSRGVHWYRKHQHLDRNGWNIVPSHGRGKAAAHATAAPSQKARQTAPKPATSTNTQTSSDSNGDSARTAAHTNKHQPSLFAYYAALPAKDQHQVGSTFQPQNWRQPDVGNINFNFQPTTAPSAIATATATAVEPTPMEIVTTTIAAAPNASMNKSLVPTAASVPTAGTSSLATGSPQKKRKLGRSSPRASRSPSPTRLTTGTSSSAALSTVDHSSALDSMVIDSHPPPNSTLSRRSATPRLPGPLPEQYVREDQRVRPLVTATPGPAADATTSSAVSIGATHPQETSSEAGDTVATNTFRNPPIPFVREQPLSIPAGEPRSYGALPPGLDPTSRSRSDLYRRMTYLMEKGPTRTPEEQFELKISMRWAGSQPDRTDDYDSQLNVAQDYSDFKTTSLSISKRKTPSTILPTTLGATPR